jgi:trimeric autotransporter adhesin
MLDKRGGFLQSSALMKTTTSPLKHSMNLSLVWLALLLIALGLACFAFLPAAQAVDPPPDGGYPFRNTAEGEDALFSLTDGIVNNTAIGYRALYSDTEGEFNTAIGSLALAKNQTGFGNTAAGVSALQENTTGHGNAAIGNAALYGNTTGTDNVATGTFALTYNTTGNGNTATGNFALENSEMGDTNTAIGFYALDRNITGSDNTAVGAQSLFSNQTGSNNIALGHSAGYNLTTGDHNIEIGNIGVADESNTIRIGSHGTHTRTFIAGINQTGVSGTAVQITTDGQLGVAPSSARFKDEIKPMDKSSEAILALKPVTFRYKKEIDQKRAPQFGLVAEEVAQVNPDLVVSDHNGKPYTVRYEAVNAMLLNEFLKEHKKVEEQGSVIAKQQKQIEALAAGFRKVSAQLELSKAAPQTVVTNQ